jgi:hypothetical protein
MSTDTKGERAEGGERGPQGEKGNQKPQDPQSDKSGVLVPRRNSVALQLYLPPLGLACERDARKFGNRLRA